MPGDRPYIEPPIPAFSTWTPPCLELPTGRALTLLLDGLHSTAEWSLLGVTCKSFERNADARSSSHAEELAQAHRPQCVRQPKIEDQYQVRNRIFCSTFGSATDRFPFVIPNQGTTLWQILLTTSTVFRERRFSKAVRNRNRPADTNHTLSTIRSPTLERAVLLLPMRISR
jgi:hypothetical protein